MGLILRPLGKRDDPGSDLDDEDDEAESEDEKQSTQLKRVAVVGGGPVECEIALNERELDGFGLDVLGNDVRRAGAERPVGSRPQDRQHGAADGDVGFVVETDWRPVRVELVAEASRWVDMHPVVFAADGHGRQADVDGGRFEYPSGCFIAGSIGDVAVPCMSVDQQLRFHAGYQPRDNDRHDLAILHSLKRDDTS